MNQKKEYFQVQIFPIVSNEPTEFISFKFEDTDYIIKPSSQLQKCGVIAGRNEAYSQTSIVDLYIEKNKSIYEPWILAERACDILSISKNNHISGYNLGVCEYSNFKLGGFSITKNINFQSEKIKNNKVLYKISENIKNSSIRDRLLSVIHLNRIAKIKFTNHLTEAITDFICSLEAIYMHEDTKGRHNNIDSEIIEGTGNAETFNRFIKKYSGHNDNYVDDLIKKVDPYGLRSAYLHRGKLISPKEESPSGFSKDLESANQWQLYNNMAKIINKSIFNYLTKEKII